ncbi:MAG TPA: hypothetical protein V6D00_10890 [Pantanalinema sp.]
MITTRAGVCLGLGLLLAGCQGAVMRPATLADPSSASYPEEVAGRVSPGALALTIHWPYRPQAIPTSTERLAISLSGPHPQSLDVLRPFGPAPTSVATLSVEVGTGYRLSVQAYDHQFEGRLVATGQSDPFSVKPNEISSVRVRLEGAIKPVITGFSPDNGGPGASVEIYGQYLGAERGLLPGFLFGGVPTTEHYPPQDGTASAVVPLSAVNGAIAPVVDGVQGDGFGTFTVLKAIAIRPQAQTVTLNGTASFEAIATTSAGVPFAGSPAVQWNVYAPFVPAAAGYRVAGFIQEDPTPAPLPNPGHIDPWGVFTADGATGTFEVAILSGRLLATASVTVTE